MRRKLPSCSTGKGFTATQMPLFALLHFQLFDVCILKALSALRAQTSIRNTTNTIKAPTMASDESLTPDFAFIKPSHIREECLALIVSYLPSLKQMVAEDQKGISTCQTPSSEYPDGILFPVNKHIYIILVGLQRKTCLDDLFY